MRIIVTGGRDFNNRKLLMETLDRLHETNQFVFLMHGGARGADSLAGEWGASRGVIVRVYPANWRRDGRAAGPIRNRQMIDEKPDIVVAFPGGRGTADMVSQAKRAGVEVIMVEDQPEQGDMFAGAQHD